MEYSLDQPAFVQMLKEEQSMLLFFERKDDQLLPIIQYRQKRSTVIEKINDEDNLILEQESIDIRTLFSNANGEVIFFVIFPYKSLISEYEYADNFEGQKMSPVKRFFRLLSTEKKDIIYILFYSVIIALPAIELPCTYTSIHL